MFYSPRLYFRDWRINVPLAGSVILQAIMWWYVAARISPTSEQIFLHYNIIFGIDLVGEWWKMFYLPASGAGILLVNYLLSYFLYGSDRLLARLISFLTVFIEILLLVGIVLIVRLNI